MAIGKTVEERLDEWKQMIEILCRQKCKFKASFALQENFSCPNVGHDPHVLIAETRQVLEIGKKLGVPQVPKFCVAHLSVEAALEIGDYEECDALLLSNTVPWKEVPLWIRLLSFGTPFSPLRWRGIKQDGGYAGLWLKGLVIAKIRELRSRGFQKPIIACGGITKQKHVRMMRDAGADAIEFATASMCRPWRVGPICRYANELTWK